MKTDDKTKYELSFNAPTKPVKIDNKVRLNISSFKKCKYYLQFLKTKARYFEP